MIRAQAVALEGVPEPPAAGSEPVRALFLYDHLGYPKGATHGLTRYCSGVLPRLHSGPVRVTACFLREPHPAAEPLARAGVTPVFLDRAKWDPRALGDVLALIRRERIELVHAVGQKGILVGCTAARLTGCASIIHLRDIYPLHPLLRPLMRAAVRSADLALCVSRAVCDHAVREYGVAPERTRLLYNGIDLGEFTPPPPERSEAWRRAAGIPDGAPTIGVVGRLARVKGHERLLRQLPRILERVPDAVLVVVGGGPLRDELEETTHRLGLTRAVRFVGQQNDIPVVLGAVDVVAIPSDHEGLCHVALEALALRRPVVARAVGGVIEALEGGKHAILVQPGDDDRLGDALASLLVDPARGAALLEDVSSHLERFRIDEHVARLRDVYLTLAGRVRDRRSPAPSLPDRSTQP